MKMIDLSGNWSFCLDKEKLGVDQKFYNKTFSDTIILPGTVSTAKKGTPSQEIFEGFLTDPYLFEGFTWYSKDVEFEDTKGKEFFLVLERTRISKIWIDDNYVGSNNSLCTSHRYQLTPFINKSRHRLTIMIDNTSYLVKGGHMTSPDTQTNWNGITGEIKIEISSKAYLQGVKIYPSAVDKQIKVVASLKGADSLVVRATVFDEDKAYRVEEYALKEGENTFTYTLNEGVIPWSEHNPKLYTLKLQLQAGDTTGIDDQIDTYNYSFGLRDFKAEGKYFVINGQRTFLRGKHDGLIFPMTGHAPTDLDSWLKVMEKAKEFGINHYRFHTCCPPEAAFRAADILGIYMEPELPFWGTVTAQGEENHDEQAQQYLIQEGFKILDEFGNHPSFVMMSMGNELWGNKSRVNEILGGYRAYDNRPLYTQGSNNFQFMPCILENEDFFCGVRFSRERLFRGSYAMCDAPQGHIQTLPPDTIHNYDEIIRPRDLSGDSSLDKAAGGDITIQYETGTKTVQMDASQEIIPEVPVVSHEVGQYAMYPDFTEISKYRGVLKARNLEVFQKRLEAKGLLHKADLFFKASGRFAAECYKAEIEAAMRSNELAGFQLLDLQDFSGQGTALVGVLNSFMEEKGVISSSEWKQFCWDTVVLAELERLVFKAGESVNVGIKLTSFKPEVIINPIVELTILKQDKIIFSKENKVMGEFQNGVEKLCDLVVDMPYVDSPQQLKLEVGLAQTQIKNSYDIWLYPEGVAEIADRDIVITDCTEEALLNLKEGRKVLLYPANLDNSNSIEGTYCTDFWCYPMFRTISESMGRAIPIGTHGLFIDKDHVLFDEFPTERYSTAQWYDIVSASRAIILDGTDLEPLVWTIDNFERNHRLGNVFELKVGEGKLLVCTSDLRKLKDSYPARWLEYSILKYMGSKDFNPEKEMDHLPFL